ncbi:MAG: glycosyltransferase [Dokdonella sp.]
MLGFLRQRLRTPKMPLHAPLRAAKWTGHRLTLELDSNHAGEIALDIDGCHFAQTRPDATGCVMFEFPFSPSGRAVIDVMPRDGRDGATLAARPLRLRFGSSGIGVAAVNDARVPALAPLLAPAQTVPFGVDVAARDVVIVVPVYNAPALVERCLDAVLAHTTGRARLIVIDDASPDAAITPLLARYAGVAGIDLLRNPSNRGFTATANRGIDAAGAADVVLLNADAEVGPNWLVGLRRAACSHDDVGTVTAVSDHAGAFSVPELEQANELPVAWSFEQSARALWQQAGLAYPELPTGNGFCLYIRRAVVDKIGRLDESAFPQGYGEENDFCQRAAQAGFRHLIAGNVLVRHARSQSFGEERRASLGAAGMIVLRERWPHYEADVGRMLYSFERCVLDWRVRRVFADAREQSAARPRLLWVGSDAPAIADAEVWILRANGSENELVHDGNVIAANTWKADDAEASYRALWHWLQLHAIERLLLRERKDSVAEILCRLLAIPMLDIDTTHPAALRESLQASHESARSFPP